MISYARAEPPWAPLAGMSGGIDAVHPCGFRVLPEMHAFGPVVDFRSMKSTGVSIVVSAWRSIVFEACAALICMAVGCGGDLPGRYYPLGRQPDGGACASYGEGVYACGCVDQPYVLAVSIALDSNGALTDLDVDLLRQDKVGVSVSANPPAKGTPGASAYFLATLVTADGTVQSSFVFADPMASVDAGSTRHRHVDFTMPLAPGTTTLNLENLDSGKPLIDLDLRGHVQLLCIDRPCLSICQAPDGGVDSSVVPELDSGAIDGT
jgi:hypothetical protein